LISCKKKVFLMLEYLRLLYYLMRPRTIFIRRVSNALGDNLLLSVLLPGIREKLPRHKIVIETPLPELFQNNPQADWVTTKHIKTTRRHIKPKYRVVTGNEAPLTAQMRAYIGLDDPFAPRLFLSSEELETIKKRFPFPYIAVCPSGKTGFSANRKEWGVENFQKLVDLFSDRRFVQIGLAKDPLLANVVDARGLAARESAAVVANAALFIGLEGGLMHLAKAVNTKAVIIYGGYVRPEISAYEENLNIYSPVYCSPCYSSETASPECPTMICMKQISPEDVHRRILEYIMPQNNIS
jgi:ADP-heptose:LPS heptosyltransferase